MSESLSRHERSSSRSPSKDAQPILTERELKSLTSVALRELCQANGIDLTGTTTKPTIIARMLGETGDSAGASARSPSASRESSALSAMKYPNHDSAKPRLVKTLTAKHDPERLATSASAPKGGQSETDNFASLTAGSIAEMSASEADKTRRKQWAELTGTLGHQPWNDMKLLIQGIDLRMFPESPKPVFGRRPMFVVTAAPPGSGKSTVSNVLSISIDSMINVDPDDAFNEFFVEMFGSFPPNPKTDAACAEWWMTHKQEFHKYETVNLEVGRVNVRPLAPKCCIAKTYNIPTQYGTILDKAEVIDHIFDKATLGGTGNLDIVFNTTGGGMPNVIDKYIARATELGYDIVVVGIYSTPKNCSDRATHRNTQQHRRMDPSLVSRLNTKFKHDLTIFNWEEKSRTHAYRLVLLENNGTPQNNAGAASVVFDRIANTVVVEPKGVLLTSGFYGMKFQGGTFVGRAEVEQEAAAASKQGERGGSSRKRRISRRRIHGSRARKTIKKYSRHVTRRHRHRHCRH